MRYDTPVYFRNMTPGAYDPATGDYADPSVSEVMRMASVCDTSVDQMKLIYGDIKHGSVTVHLQRQYKDPFTEIRIGDKFYKVDMRHKYRFKDAFVLTEVHHGTGNTADRD